MAHTYSGDPTASNTEQVRFQIGDTDSDDWQLTDEEIQYQLVQGGVTLPLPLSNTIMVSVKLCRRLAAKYARRVSQMIGRYKDEAENKYNHYLKLGDALLREATNWTPYAGGLSKSDKQINTSDPDWVAPFFSREMMAEGLTDTTTEQNQELAV